MAETTPELEAKLLKRRQKCEGSAPSPPAKGSRAWNDEMAKTVSQQRRARLAQGDGRVGTRTGPSSASSSSSRPKQGKDFSSGSRGRVFGASLAVFGLLGASFIWRQNQLNIGVPLELPSESSEAGAPQVPEEVIPEDAKEDLEGNTTEEPQEAEEDVPFDREHFSAMVRESSIQSHHSSVAADSRAPRDLTEEWEQFLSENPTIGQVYRLGRLTVTEAEASRAVAVTINITLMNLGLSAWPARAAVQIAHGADLGMEAVQLTRVTEPGEARKVTLHLKVPRQVDSPSCIWALSLDGRVFGVLLLLELDWIESKSSGLLGQATDILQSARANVVKVKLQTLDEALRADESRQGDVTQEWSADLVRTSVTQAYRLGSIQVAPRAQRATLEILLTLENSGQDEWPEGTELNLVSGHSFGFESREMDAPVSPWSRVQVLMPLKIDHKDVILEESVWALSFSGHSFGPLLVLEIRYN